MRFTSPRARRIAIATVLAAGACVAGLAPAGSAAAKTVYVNPIAGYPWGIYRGASDGLYPAYENAKGATRAVLRRMALTPHVRWYTSFIPASDIAEKVSADITQEQAGNPNVLVWMAMFRLWPYHESAKMRPLTLSDRDAYKRWVNNAARGIGSSRVAIVLEPDLPVTMKSWHPAVRYALVRYAAQHFSALPNTTVYLDAGSADWRNVGNDVAMLSAAGIGYVHGFELGSTHHTATAAEVRYGRQVSMALARAGYGMKHYIIDTSDNGHGYTWGQFYRAHPNGDFNDPPACTSMTERDCVALGIPPTTDVTSSAWGLPTRLTKTLQRRCDGFVWIGRPWMADNGQYFSLQKAINETRTSPYTQYLPENAGA